MLATIQARTQAGLWWLAALAILMATAARVGASEFGIPAFDRQGLVLANAWRSPWLDAAFPVLTWFGSLAVLLPLVLVAGILLWRRGRHAEAGFVIAALASAAGFAQLVKRLTLRPRPDLFPPLVSVASPLSFPSAHAVQVAAVAAALMLLVWRRAPHGRALAIVCAFSLVVLVDFSRLYLQVHYPSDVLAGSLAAGCWVVGLHKLIRA